MAIISVNYDEPNATDTYKSVTFSTRLGEHEFNSGDFVKDWWVMMKLILTTSFDEPISNSSSVNHFIMDGAPFDSAWLHFVNDEPVLKYITKENNFLSISEGIEFFVEKGTRPTWKELKEICTHSSTG